MIRRLGIGLVLAVTALMSAQAAAAKDDPTAGVPDAVAAAKLPCTVTASHFIAEGTTTDKDKTKAKFYEVACAEGMGYVLITPDDKTKTPTAYDCYSASQPDKDGKKGALACVLPANANPDATLQALMTKVGQSCKLTKSRWIGGTPDSFLYEVACDSGAGYILSLPRTTTADKAQAYSCLDDLGANVSCTLTDKTAFITAQVTKLLAASGKTCALKDQRFVGEAATTPPTDFYEAACQAGDGYMLQSNLDGSFKDAVNCSAASQILNGCKLTDATAALTSDNDVYTKLAKQAGFDCTVSGYIPQPTDNNTNDVDELICSNRPDGGVGVFPNKGGGAGIVYDCLRAQNYGYSCAKSKVEVLYSKLSQQLVAKGRGSCTVNGAAPFGATDDTDLVEVSCSDGNPGWVIEYPKADQAPKDLLTCGQASHISKDGCTLPTNRKHG